MWNFEIKLLQINITSDVSDKHYSNDMEEWPLRIIKISKFRVLYYFVSFYDKYSFVFCFNKLSFFHLNCQ